MRAEINENRDCAFPAYSVVMPGLVPGIHAFHQGKQDVDGRDKPGHDDWDNCVPAQFPSRQMPSASCAGRSEIENSTASLAALCE